MMAIITKITTQKKNKERYNIFLNEDYAFSVDEAVLAKFQLKKGMELDELDISEIQFDDEVKKAFNAALVFLSYRMRSKKEIIDYLKKKEVDEPIIPEVLHKLTEYKYVDDAEFAKSYCLTQINTTLKGPEVIKQELIEKGIEKELITSSLELYTKEAQIESAIKLIEKNIKKTTKLSDLVMKQKLEIGLQRKGYTWDVIQIAMEELNIEKEQDEEWEALLHQATKAKRKYEKYEGWEYDQKMKQALYRKGFSLEMIEKYLQKDGD